MSAFAGGVVVKRVYAAGCCATAEIRREGSVAVVVNTVVKIGIN
jgi:hypothetical protein